MVIEEIGEARLKDVSRQHLSDRGIELDYLFEIFRSALRHAGDVGDRYAGRALDEFLAETGNNCGEVGLIVLRGAVDGQMKIRRVGVDEQGRREGMGPAYDHIGAVFAILSHASGETGTSDIAVGAIERAQEGSTDLIVFA